MSRALLAVSLVLAVLAHGCTGSPSSAGDFEGEEKRVAEVVEQLASAGETGDAAEICDDVLSRELREQVQEAGSSCEQELDEAISDADDFDLDVEDVTIRGDSATAEVKGGEDRVRQLEFVRDGRDWRASSLGS